MIMDISLKEFVQMLITVFAGGLASYIAIRSDLSDLKARMRIVEQNSDKAHERVDGILMERRK